MVLVTGVISLGTSSLFNDASATEDNKRNHDRDYKSYDRDSNKKYNQYKVEFPKDKKFEVVLNNEIVNKYIIIDSDDKKKHDSYGSYYQKDSYGSYEDKDKSYDNSYDNMKNSYGSNDKRYDNIYDNMKNSYGSNDKRYDNSYDNMKNSYGSNDKRYDSYGSDYKKDSYGSYGDKDKSYDINDMTQYMKSYEKDNYKDELYNSYDSSQYSDDKIDMKNNEYGSDYGDDNYKKSSDQKVKYGTPYFKDNQDQRYNPY